MTEKKLGIVYSQSTVYAPDVTATWGLSNSTLEVRFKVENSVPFTNSTLSKTTSQWGLWDWDVVEIFLSLSPNRLPYYEFQVSPLGQFLELEIIEPRKNTNRDFQSGFSHSVCASKNGWTAEMMFDLNRFGWDGKPESLSAGFFSILGEGEDRTYLSAFLPPQSKPDFHLPQHFKQLF